MFDIIMANGGGAIDGGDDRWGFKLLGDVERRELDPDVKSETR